VRGDAVEPREAVAVAAWAVYCIALTAVVAEDHFAPSVFALYAPAQLLLGGLVPRWHAVVAPPLLSLLLGGLAYEVACPCYENEAGFFFLLWFVLFALPGSALVAIAIAVRRRLRMD